MRSFQAPPRRPVHDHPVFEAGTFVQRKGSEQPKAFILEGEVGRPGDYYQTHPLFSLGQRDRRDWLTRNLELADREPTDAELAAFVAWRLTQ